MSTGAVSVVIPCYDAAEDIGDAIESVLRQTGNEHVREVVVVDDGSTDQTETVVRRWKAEDERVRYMYQANQGPSVARNRGVSESTGSLVAFLDADDVWRPGKLETQVPFLQQHPEVALVCSDYIEEKNGNRRRIWARHLDYRQDDLLESLYLRGGPVMMSTVVLRKHVFESVGGFDPEILKGQDTDLWLRIAAEWSVHHLPVPLVVKRIREESVSADMPTKIRYLREITDRIAERYPRLESYRDRRHAMLSELLIRTWLQQGKKRRAREEVLRTLRAGPVTFPTVVLFILSILPISASSAQAILDGLGRIRGRLSEIKRKVTERIE
jgi:glycosyltransferase involved in cell wall biosynthesis